jgi:uncharacterized protein
MRFNLLYAVIYFIPFSMQAELRYQEPWGKDSDLRTKTSFSSEQEKKSVAVYLANQVILFHQKVISPVDGPRSHYRPSSSQYMQQAMQKHGFVKGFIMGCDRLLRENKDPWVYRSIQSDGKIFKYDPPR